MCPDYDSRLATKHDTLTLCRFKDLYHVQNIAASILTRTKKLDHISPVSVSVYYVAVRTIVLSRHGGNRAKPAIIHDIIHSLMCMPSTPHCGFSGVSPDGNCAYVHWGSITPNTKSVRRAIWFTWFSEPRDSTSLHDVLVYTAPDSHRRSPNQFWTGCDVA